MPKIDAFAKVVSIEGDTVVVKSEGLTENPADTFRIKFREISDKFSTSDRMASVVKSGIGSNLLLSGLHVENYTSRLNNENTLECDFTHLVTSDINRCKTGFVSLKGVYYSSKQKGKDRLTEAAVWGNKAYRPNSDNYNSFCDTLDARAAEVKGSKKGEVLPFHGYMLKAEKDGVLLEYSRPASCMNDISPQSKDYGPISAAAHKKHMALFTSSAIKAHGEEIKISITPFTRYMVSSQTYGKNGGLVVNPHARNHQSIALKTPKRSTFEAADRFGGHFSAKLNGAVVISNDLQVDGGVGTKRRWIATRLGMSGAQVLTALIADSPYTNRTLSLHPSLEDVQRRTKTDAIDGQSASKDKLNRNSEPSVLDQPLKTETPDFSVEADATTLSKFRFVEAGVTRDGDYVGYFAYPDGRQIDYTVEEIATKLNTFSAHGLDTTEYEKAWEKVYEVQRYYESIKAEVAEPQEPQPTTTNNKIAISSMTN